MVVTWFVNFFLGLSIRVVAAGSTCFEVPVEGVVSGLLNVVSIVRVMGRVGMCMFIALSFVAMTLVTLSFGCSGRISARGLG